ncbi:MAG: hypothetical protein CMH57_06290 [Myxococcales bacterium]|nr:hypothetical protein [Myxococcales bacterium]
MTVVCAEAAAPHAVAATSPTQAARWRPGERGLRAADDRRWEVEVSGAEVMGMASRGPPGCVGTPLRPWATSSMSRAGHQVQPEAPSALYRGLAIARGP